MFVRDCNIREYLHREQKERRKYHSEVFHFQWDSVLIVWCKTDNHNNNGEIYNLWHTSFIITNNGGNNLRLRSNNPDQSFWLSQCILYVMLRNVRECFCMFTFNHNKRTRYITRNISLNSSLDSIYPFVFLSIYSHIFISRRQLFLARTGTSSILFPQIYFFLVPAYE